jgi:excisionase family DNA binding protein
MSKAALTVCDVARESSMSERQVYRLLKEGKLKARKSGRKTLILAEDFRAWLASLPSADLEAA